ncbi:MAG: hypothetical protein WB870_02380, partial [Gallionellaceae bacterium]
AQRRQEAEGMEQKRIQPLFIAFTVLGTPIAQGSMKRTRHGGIHNDNQKGASKNNSGKSSCCCLTGTPFHVSFLLPAFLP